MKQVEIQFVKYDSAYDIVISYFRYNHPRMKLKKLLKQKTEFQLDLEYETVYPGTVEEVIRTVKRLGMWGFCDKITNGAQNPHIHYWVGSAKPDKIKILELFTHEVSHAIGYSSENMAVRFGGVAAFSYAAMMEEVYNKRSHKTNKPKRLLI